MAVRSADMLVTTILQDPQLREDIKQDPAGVLNRAATQAKAATPLENDKWIYRGVVLVLGLLSITSVAGLIALSFNDTQNIPDGLIALGSAAVGALSGLLAPSPAGRS